MIVSRNMVSRVKGQQKPFAEVHFGAGYCAGEDSRLQTTPGVWHQAISCSVYKLVIDWV